MKTNHCHQGDALKVLRTLPDDCVQTCVTSPPYWGLRDYKTGAWEGGDPDCDHLGPVAGGTAASTLGDYSNGLCDETIRRRLRDVQPQCRRVCRHCGATRTDQQMGSEPTVGEWVAGMVAVFDEVRRLLRDDGTLWLNLGDSHAANRAYQVADSKHVDVGNSSKSQVPDGLKPKDLIGQPWRLAFSLQESGWYLRSDIIWHKPNPMPESVTDRPTRAHEYMFLLSKSANYYYDSDAIAEKTTTLRQNRNAGYARSVPGQRSQHGLHQGGPSDANDRRNKRSVWTVPTAPFPAAHFATFPPALIEPCILAGSRPGDVVLDPFMGSGTTAQVAQHLGRRWIGVELNGDYITMQHQRTAQTSLDFAR